MVAAGIATGQAGRPSGSSALAMALAAGVAVALYAVTLGYGLVFDDLSLIGRDGPLALGNGMVPYRPLRYLSYRVDHWLGGGGPWAYHLSNVVLHGLAAALAAALAIRLGASAFAAGVAGIAVAVHPLAAEAAAYVAGRRDLLAAVFTLGALLAWASRRGRTAWAILLAVAAVASKESAALLVLLFVLASTAGLGPSLARARAALLCLAVVAIALPVAYGAIGPLAPRGSLCTALATVTRMATHYASHLVIPVGLSIEYPALARIACESMLGARVIFGFVLLGLSAGVLLAGLAPRSGDEGADPLRFVWSWTASTFLSIALVVGAHEPGADRHAYPLVAALAVALAVTATRALAGRRGPWARRGVVATAVAWLAWATLLTAQLLPAWRSERALWTRAVVTAPESGRAHHNLAGVLLAAGELRAAAAEARIARSLEYPPAILGDAAIACARGLFHRGLLLLARAERRGLPAADIARIAATCRQDGR